MPEVNITTNIAPATVNMLRMNLYLAKSDNAVIASIDQAWQAENHWTFTDLESTVNYVYNLFEIDANGLVLQQYTNNPNFTVRSAGSIEVKSPQDVIVDTTPGVATGTNSATFDDWKGWDITIEDIGAGTMERGVSYSYDISTGTLSLLGPDHVFIPNQRFFVRFEPRVIAGGGSTSVSKDLWSGVMLVSQDTTLVSGDAGKKIIISGASTFLAVTLPDLVTVKDNALFFFETTKGSHINIAITSPNGNAIDFLEGGRTSIYMGQNERLVMYRYQTNWRVDNFSGNFLTVGSEFTSHADNIYNAVELNGAQLSIKDYTRLYNDFVLRKNSADLVSFDTWFVGNNGLNKFKFSLANAQGLFFIPDLRGQYHVNSGAAGNVPGEVVSRIIKPGDFQTQTMLDARVALFSDGGPTNGKPSSSTFVGWSSARMNGNQDYDLLIGNSEPTIGVSGKLVDRNGQPLPVSNAINTNRVASRRFIVT